MATAAQTLANRANASHSTGPRTPEGKARSARNAFRHGLTAARLIVRDDEHETFDTLRADLLTELDPHGVVETLVFNELLHAAWNLHRFRRIEAEHASTAGLSGDNTAPDLPDRLGRYQARAQRAFYRALGQLRKLQTDRALRSLKLTEEEETAVPAIADINELTKQTQSEVTAKALDIALQMVDYEAGICRLETTRKYAPRTSAAAPLNP